MQNQKNPAEELEKMINHLAVAGIASETLVKGLLPVAENFGQLSAALGQIYANAKGAAAERLVAHDYSREEAVRAAEAIDQHIDKALDIVAAVLLSRQQG